MSFDSEPLDLNGNDSAIKLPALLPTDYSRLIAEVSARLSQVFEQHLNAEF